jgi:molecular chaperone GrpE
VTDSPYDENVTPEGEEPTPAPSPAGGIADEAAETAPETGIQTPVDTDADDEPVAPTGPSDRAGQAEAARDEAAQDELAVTKMELAERTADLQRLQAEFVNYKRRVDRDRELIRENATYAALTPIIEVLDTIDRAREHAPIDGGFKAVADQLERTVAAVGLTKFGAVGDAFDPTVHEALSHIGEDPEVDVTTCKVVAKAGYRIGDRVVRAAQVLVVDPPTA